MEAFAGNYVQWEEEAPSGVDGVVEWGNQVPAEWRVMVCRMVWEGRSREVPSSAGALPWL